MPPVEMSPKALRFARLAAEQEPELAADPHVDLIKREETAPRGSEGRRFLRVEEETAEFCLQALTALLARENDLSTSDWDGNDILFMRSVAWSLRQQLSPSVAQSI